MRHQPNNRQGAALLLALIVTAIISALLSGVLLLGVSHLALSNTNSEYANALNLAEAGVNEELWKITQNTNNADLVWTPWIQFPGEAARPADEVRRWYRVKIEPDGAGPWTPPDPLWIIADGNVGGTLTSDGLALVGGVTRTVRVRAKGFSIFGEYALFGINELNVGGNATINGATGTDGLVDINGRPNFNGNFWYCGSGAVGDSVTGLVTGDILYSSLPEVFPTVNEVATEWAQSHYDATGPQTVEFFKTHNQNDTIVDSTGASVQIRSFSLDMQTFKNTSGTIILEPGDYYFEKLELPSTNTIQVNSAAGNVNIWIGPEGGTGKDDTINGSMLFTAPDATRFHLYDGSNRALKMNGTMDFYGMFLVYNGPNKNGRYYGSVEILGTADIYGSVIGYDVSRTTGDSQITFPSGGGGPEDPISHYGFDMWEEVNPL